VLPQASCCFAVALATIVAGNAKHIWDLHQQATLKSKRLAELENPRAIEIKCGFVDISDGDMAGV
jgi:hypothetical protein